MPGRSRGQLLPLMAFATIPVMAMAALAIDMSYWRDEQRKQQAAADSAAVAGAIELTYAQGTASPKPFITAAKNDAATNGYTDNGSTTLITVNNPPATGNYTSDTNAVEAIVNVKHSTFFAGAYGHTGQWVKTRAVATISAGSGGCIVLLDASASPNTFTGSNGTINTGSTCGIKVDGTWNTSNGTYTAPTIGVTGTIVQHSGTFGTATPAPMGSTVGDSCSQLSGCAYLTNNPPATTPCDYTNYQTSSNATLSPGVYCGGIHISGGTVTFNSGLYVLTGSNGLQISGGTETGSGVTFYFASGATSVQISNGNMNLTAPTSGNYKGVMFYQVSGNTNQPKISGGGGTQSCPETTTALTGFYYFPSAQFTMSNGAVSPSAIVADSLNISNGWICILNPPSFTSSTSTAVLVE